MLAERHVRGVGATVGAGLVVGPRPREGAADGAKLVVGAGDDVGVELGAKSCVVVV